MFLSLSFRLELIPPRLGVSHADPPSSLVSIISDFNRHSSWRSQRHISRHEALKQTEQTHMHTYSSHTHTYKHTYNTHTYRHICTHTNAHTNAHTHTYKHIHAAIRKNCREGLVFPVLGRVAGHLVLLYFTILSM